MAVIYRNINGSYVQLSSANTATAEDTANLLSFTKVMLKQDQDPINGGDAFDFQTSEPTSEGGTTVVPPIGKYQAMLDQANVDVDNDVVTLNSGSASTMQPTIRFRDLDVWTAEQPQPDAFDFKAMEAADTSGNGGRDLDDFVFQTSEPTAQGQPTCYLRYTLDRANDTGDGKDDLVTYQPDSTAGSWPSEDEDWTVIVVTDHGLIL